MKRLRREQRVKEGKEEIRKTKKGQEGGDKRK